MTRQLVTKRTVRELTPIAGADRIELAHIDGWQCVVKKGDFAVGQEGLYFEIDSMIPATDARFQFLSKGKVTPFYRIKSMRLKATLSQGLLMPLSIMTPCEVGQMDRGEELQVILGVKLYEPPLPTSGKQVGTFPIHLVPKTDQERIQNIPSVLNGRSFLDFEVTEKLDGTSCTIWFHSQKGVVALQDSTQMDLKRNPYVGVASRNWEMLREDENVYSKALRENDLVNKLGNLRRNIAIQGEIIGPGIQGNKYGLPQQELYVFDVYDIDEKRYLMFFERWEIVEQLGLKHVPILRDELHKKFNWDPANTDPSQRGDPLTFDSVLSLADGVSALNADTMREGVVFKAVDGSTSFKAISNEWLLKHE